MSYTSFKSVKHSEFLYTNKPMLDDARRLTYTWGGKDIPSEDDSMRFEVKDYGDYVGIKSIKYNEWMYAYTHQGETSQGGSLGKDRRYVLFWAKAGGDHGGDPTTDENARWEIHDVGGGYVGIKNVLYQEWMMMQHGNKQDRRRVLCWADRNDHPSTDPDLQWIMDNPSIAMNLGASKPTLITTYVDSASSLVQACETCSNLP